MGRNQTKTCDVCFKSVRGDILKRHMKKHEVKTEDNDVTKGLHDGKTEDNIGTNEEQISCIYEELEKSVSAQMDEFDRKMELGRKLNKIMDKHGYNENGLNHDMMVALKTYKLHGKNMDMKDIEWRGWQKDLRQYLDKPCDRKLYGLSEKKEMKANLFSKPI